MTILHVARGTLRSVMAAVTTSSCISVLDGSTVSATWQSRVWWARLEAITVLLSVTQLRYCLVLHNYGTAWYYAITVLPGTTQLQYCQVLRNYIPEQHVRLG